jgi:hypothetical protein
MTRQDFLLILVEAIAHEPIDAFFRAKQKRWGREGYSKSDFQQGLLNAYKWLYFEACRPDPFRYELKKPGGAIENGYVFEDYEEKTEALKKEGKLAFPFCKTIYIRREPDHKLIWYLDVTTLDDLWFHLFAFLNPNFDFEEPIPPPPLSNPYEPADEYDNTILVPDSIAALFKNPNLPPELDNVQNRFPALAGQIPFTDRQALNTTNHSSADQQDKPASFTSRAPEEITGSSSVKTNSKKALSINQYALIQFYEGRLITRENCSEKVKECGNMSGEKLYQRFLFYSSSDRRARPDTNRQLRNKIKLFESIMGSLSRKARERAEMDLARLRGYMDYEEF